MEPIAWIPQYENMKILAEIDVRGRFLMMSADVEFTMLLIMTYLSPDPFNQIRNFTGMMMHNKIECTIADVKKYRPDLYKEYQKDLEKLWEFKVIRNDIAHYKMQFEDSESPKFFDVYYVDEENGAQRLFSKHYLIAEAAESVRRFRRLNMKLYKLFQIVQEQVLKDNPEISEQIDKLLSYGFS